MEFKRYFLQEDESELRQIEKDIANYLMIPFVRCGYDVVNSHKCQDQEEMKYVRRVIEEFNNIGSTYFLDYKINYEKYKTIEDYNKNEGGYDGEVYEISYLKGNGNYIVITRI